MIKLIVNKESQLENTYTYADESIVTMGNKLIATHHDIIKEANICILMRSGSWKSSGKTIYGKAHKVSERDNLLTGLDFIIVLNQDAWNRLDDNKRKAILDHELCHCDAEEDGQGNPVWKIASHDVEEFSAIVKRHGLYMEDLEQFMDSALQMNIVDISKSAS